MYIIILFLLCLASSDNPDFSFGSQDNEGQIVFWDKYNCQGRKILTLNYSKIPNSINLRSRKDFENDEITAVQFINIPKGTEVTLCDEGNFDLRAKDDHATFTTKRKLGNYCIRNLEYSRNHPYYKEHYSSDYEIVYNRKDGLNKDVSSLRVRKNIRIVIP